MRVKIVLLSIIFSLLAVVTTANDGIPDNCETTSEISVYSSEIFARYEPSSQRLMLVNWNSGEDVLALATGIEDTLIRGWSLECHYLAVAVANGETRDTVVFNALTGIEIGRVPDAQGVPHTITWGPNDFLVVETRNHAVLWDIRQNIQYALNVGFNTTTHRNFTRIRWDAENQNVLFNLATGGRVAYDLATGTETVISRSRPGELILGGESFTCSRERQQPLGSTVPDLDLFYAPDGNVIYIGSRYSNGVRYSSTRESIQTLEAGTPYVNISPMGWSANCRYVAAALNPDDGIEDVYQTVIWDVIEQRRIGTFPDANLVPHRLTWDTAENYAMIETHNGAFLWNLQTDERQQINAEVLQTPSNCYEFGDNQQYCNHYQPRSFYYSYWDAGRQQFLGVPIQSPDSVVAYDVNTGLEVNRIALETTPDSRPIQFITSDDSRIMVTLLDRTIRIIDRETNTTVYEIETNLYNLDSASAISLDNRYLAVLSGNHLYVWDIQAQDTQPTYLHENVQFRAFGGVGFVNGEVLVSGSRKYPTRINVVTGELSGWQTASEINYQPVAGTSGFSTSRWATHSCEEVIRYDEQQNLVQLVDNQGHITAEVQDVFLRNNYQWYDINLSPDCRTLQTQVATTNIDLTYEEIPEFYATQVAFWDVETGSEIASFGTRQTGEWGSYRAVYWSPDSERAMIGAIDGFYILNINTGEIAEAEQPRVSGGRISYYPSSVYWNYERGLIFVSYLRQVVALDMITGEVRLQFTPIASYRNPYFEFSEDENWIFIYGRSALGVWNLDTLENYELNISSGGHRGVTISPSGRYLAVARNTLRVFDLHGDIYTPIYATNFEDSDFESLRFIDDTSIEITVNGNEQRELLIADIIEQTLTPKDD